MLTINLNNVETMVFYDQKLQKLLPEFKNIFGQWRLSKIDPSLKPTGQRAMMDFLNSVNEEHIEILSNYFDSDVSINKLDYHIVKNIDFPVSEAESNLINEKFFNNTVLYRKGNQLYISLWR